MVLDCYGGISTTLPISHITQVQLQITPILYLNYKMTKLVQIFQFIMIFIRPGQDSSL